MTQTYTSKVDTRTRTVPHTTTHGHYRPGSSAARCTVHTHISYHSHIVVFETSGSCSSFFLLLIQTFALRRTISRSHIQSKQQLSVIFSFSSFYSSYRSSYSFRTVSPHAHSVNGMQIRYCLHPRRLLSLPFVSPAGRVTGL